MIHYYVITALYIWELGIGFIKFHESWEPLKQNTNILDKNKVFVYV